MQLHKTLVTSRPQHTPLAQLQGSTAVCGAGDRDGPLGRVKPAESFHGGLYPRQQHALADIATPCTSCGGFVILLPSSSVALEPSRRGELKAKIEGAPVDSRTTLRGLAASTGIPRTQLFRPLIERSVLKRVTDVPTPLLTPEHNAKRHQFVRSVVKKLPGERGYEFVDMQNVVHVDEQWFYVHLNRNIYYLTSDETAPRAVTINKNHRTKLAVHNSKKWPKGTPGTTPVELTKGVYERMLTHHVIPALKRVWSDKEQVIVQLDNPPPHRASARTAVKA
uniref:Uncharacterized protein n=1 Tax=Phytophthora fragariae TaxID=53985 RepID=A0A6A3FAG4_9STRA|nr:hypothetical protein PF009_g8593 [Phytophthora fragariae]